MRVLFARSTVVHVVPLMCTRGARASVGYTCVGLMRRFRSHPWCGVWSNEHLHELGDVACAVCQAWVTVSHTRRKCGAYTCVHSPGCIHWSVCTVCRASECIPQSALYHRWRTSAYMYTSPRNFFASLVGMVHQLETCAFSSTRTRFVHSVLPRRWLGVIDARAAWAV